mmetsp:Transcript_27908/g.41164  ORF Transcript_27908/g.41164 Transcript_27908/m.41164 type:complete len:276 (-) Transcript_27908:315-1142(-)
MLRPKLNLFIHQQLHHSASELSIDVIPKIHLFKTSAHDLQYVGVDLERVKILKSKAAAVTCDAAIKQDIRTLEFCVVVGDIFNSILLCKQERINESNINSERFLRTRTEYFARMRRAHLARKDDARFNGETRSWQRTGIASETFRNFSLTVSGFIAYAKEMIRISAQIMPGLYIPLLHSNQSTIESLFSLIRSMNFDRVDKFSKGYGSLDFRHAARAVSLSKTYEEDNLDEEAHDFDTLQRCSLPPKTFKSGCCFLYRHHMLGISLCYPSLQFVI